MKTAANNPYTNIEKEREKENQKIISFQKNLKIPDSVIGDMDQFNATKESVLKNSNPSELGNMSPDDFLKLFTQKTSYSGLDAGFIAMKAKASSPNDLGIESIEVYTQVQEQCQCVIDWLKEKTQPMVDKANKKLSAIQSISR